MSKVNCIPPRGQRTVQLAPCLAKPPAALAQLTSHLRPDIKYLPHRTQGCLGHIIWQHSTFPSICQKFWLQSWTKSSIIPPYPGVAQFGRALALGARCRRFESCRPDHVVADYMSFATTFFQKVISHSLRRSSFPNATRWGWARIWCLGVVSRVIRKLFYGLSGNRLQRRRPWFLWRADDCRERHVVRLSSLPALFAFGLLLSGIHPSPDRPYCFDRCHRSGTANRDVRPSLHRKSRWITL